MKRLLETHYAKDETDEKSEGMKRLLKMHYAKYGKHASEDETNRYHCLKVMIGNALQAPSTPSTTEEEKEKQRARTHLASNWNNPSNSMIVSNLACISVILGEGGMELMEEFTVMRQAQKERETNSQWGDSALWVADSPHVESSGGAAGTSGVVFSSDKGEGSSAKRMKRDDK